MKAFLLPLFILLTVTAFAQPIITHTTPLAFCQGDSVVLEASGYTNVLWLPGGETTTSITVLDSNTYQFIANPGTPNASASNTVTTTVHPLPTGGFTGQYTICGGCAYVSAPSGYAGYLWTNGDTTQSTCCSDGLCDVYFTNEFGCTAYGGGYSIYNWGEPSPLNLVLEANKLVVTQGGNGYAWTINGNFITNWQNSYYIPTVNGNYAVRRTNGMGCTSYSNVYNLTNVGVDEQAAQNFTVFPNPVQTSTTITNSSADALWYTLYTSTGQLVMSKQKSTDKATEINLSGLENGIYLLQIEQNGYSSYQKIIKI